MKVKFYIFYFVLLPFYLSSQNTAIQFNGLNGHVTVPHKATLNLQAEYTIEAWIFANEWKSLSWQGSIFCNDGQGPDGGFAFRCGDNGKLSFVISEDNVWNEIISPAIMNTKQWHHVVAQVDNGNTYLYIDGQRVASGTYSGNLVAKNQPFSIGESTGFRGRIFNGAIDEVRVWSTVRTPQELVDFKSTDLNGDEEHLEGYWQMNDGSGRTVTNKVDPACNGTMVDLTDNNWVEGYKLPDYDLSVKNISGIDRLTMNSRPVKISVDVQNTGTKAISGASLSVLLNGQTIISEPISQDITAGQLITYSFTTPLILFDDDDPTIDVVVSHPDDANSLNNETSIQLVSTKDNFVSLFERSQHNFAAAGQLQSTKLTLPGDLSLYDQILLHLSVDCPSTGCDPWDQTANVVVRTSKGSFEIMRYITPYGIACGPWTVDVTDFKSILVGDVTFESFIQVFGPSGWLVTAELEFVHQATPSYSKVTPIHQTNYHVYGDPGIDDDLDPVSIDVDANTETSHIRMHISGHGQGNTNNAAEFYRVTHQVVVNGSTVQDHLLWKADCAANTCANQAGNWLFARAGWCPGQEVIPAIFNITGDVTPGESATLDYELQEYTNLLNTGYNNSGHTEPHYRIQSVLVEESSSRYEDFTNLTAVKFDTLITPTNKKLSITVANNGNTVVDASNFRLFVNGELKDDQQISTISPEEEVLIPSVDLSTLKNGDVIIAEINSQSDQSPGDNLLSFVFQGATNIDDPLMDVLYQISPNPTSGNVTITFDQAIQGGQVMIYSISGQIVAQEYITTPTMQFGLDKAGMYYITISNTSRQSSTKKLIVIH